MVSFRKLCLLLSCAWHVEAQGTEGTGLTATDAPSESTSAPSTTDLADFPATSLPVVHQWTVQRGTTGGDFGRAMQVDESGNVLVAGQTTGSLDGNTNAGESDVFLMKFNSFGVRQWTVQRGTLGADECAALQVDGSGNAWLAGNTDDQLDGNTNAGEADILLMKIDGSGVHQWTVQHGGSARDFSHALQIDGSGNAWIAGMTYSSLDGHVNAGDVDLFVMKFDSVGAHQWTAQRGGPGEDIAHALQEHIERLSGLWKCRRISHVQVPMEELSFPDREERFARVFTKLRGLGLTEYEKVLMMDIDLLVRQNIDDLFNLPAPAALRRGMNDWGQSRHGRPIDGTSILLGEDKSQPRWSWGQGTGINAGVMLWQPNQEMLDEMLAELDEPNHPEHVRGNGPEQDYLSRTWADAPWTHIGAQYNFQLHQMFFALHPDRAQYAERANLLEHPERIKIVHYSGKPTAKPWHRVLDPRWKDFWPSRSRDEEYVKLFAEEFMGYWLWILRDAEKFQLQAEGPNASWDMARLELGEDGEYYRKDWRDPTVRQHLPIPARRAQGAMQLLTSVLQEWFDIYESLEAELPSLRYGAFASRLRPGPVRTLRPRLERPAALKRTCWKRQSRQAWWMEVEKLPKSSQPKGPADAKPSKLQKVTASCGISPEGVASVSLRDSDSTFDEEGLDVEGLYIKHYGQVAARHFQIHDLSPEGLEPLQLWASTIPDGAILLMAMVGIAGDVTPLLHTLAQLGVPQEAPPEHCKVLACVSMAGEATERKAMANHASPDVAYASLLLDPQLL